MGRILFFVLLALLAVVVYKTLKRRSIDRESGQAGQLPRDNRPADIRPCRHCGAYTPVEAGVMLEGRFYCSRDHAQASGEKIGA